MFRITPFQNNNDRVKRDLEASPKPPAKPEAPKNETERQARKFCDQGGVFCMLYKAINGESTYSSPSSSVHLPLERRDDVR